MSKEHYGYFQKIAKDFDVQIITSKNISADFMELEIMAFDYMVIYGIGYAIGSITMSDELMPLLKKNEAKMLNLQASAANLEYMKNEIERMQKETGGENE